MMLGIEYCREGEGIFCFIVFVSYCEIKILIYTMEFKCVIVFNIKKLYIIGKKIAWDEIHFYFYLELELFRFNLQDKNK